jgi:hypothetical protein
VRIEKWDESIDRCMRRAEAAASYEKLRKRGEELRQRLHKVGVWREPRLLVIARKR